MNKYDQPTHAINCMKLWFSVLIDGIHGAIWKIGDKPIKVKCGEREVVLKKHASFNTQDRAWIMSDSNGFNSFNNICKMLEKNPNKLRRKILTDVEETVSDREFHLGGRTYYEIINTI